jgi:two-component system, chemotaxis family, protein-glutamate methylesterase/glutaminase
MITDKPIRVLVVDDTVTYRKIVSETLAGVPGIEVVGTAANGRIALQKIAQLRPDLLTLDLEMPEIDGLEVLRWLKNTGSEVGAIVLSGTTAQSAGSTVSALGLGAFDFVLKPANGTMEENTAMLRHELRPRIQAFAQAKEVRTILHSPGAHPPHVSNTPRPLRENLAPYRIQTVASGILRPEVVALGISTGGPQALTRVLPQLPADLGVPVLIVQHMPPVFTKSLADDLNRRCKMAVCEAGHGQPVRPGLVLIAPGGKQMKVERRGEQIVVCITDDPPENSCRPSVDYLFRSVSQVWGCHAIGVIMTGMGSDGTRGCRDMKRLGASIIAQDESSSVVFGMPKGPIDEGIADVVAPLQGIAAEIVRLTRNGEPACK